MRHWERCITNPDLREVYELYLQKQERILTFYLISVAVSKHADFPREHHGLPVRASNNFPESLTSIRSVGQVSEMVADGRYDQLSRSMNIIALVTSFGDFFGDIRKLLKISDQDIKRPLHLDLENRPLVQIRPAALKIANLANRDYELDARVCDHYSIRWINCVINLRHIFIHEGGQFNEKYSKDMFGAWADMRDGESVVFSDNQFDAVLWFLNDHVRDFVERLDKKLSHCP